MRHIFVESNWVVSCCAPTHMRTDAAELLLQGAREGAWVLHLPAICLREGAKVIREKYQPRLPEEMKRFVNTHLPDAESQVMSRVFSLYQSRVSKELNSLESTLEALRATPNVDAFALSDEMLERAIKLRLDVPDKLEPFDEAILAAILVRAAALRKEGAEDIVFCTLDRDLHPWTRQDERREQLASLYERAGILVHSAFDVEQIDRPLS